MARPRTFDDLPSELLFRIAHHLEDLHDSPPASPRNDVQDFNPWLFTLPASTTPGLPITPLGPIVSTPGSRRGSNADGYFAIGPGVSLSRRPSRAGLRTPGGSPYHSQASSYSFDHFLNVASISGGFLVPPPVGTEPPLLGVPVGYPSEPAAPMPSSGFRIPALPTVRDFGARPRPKKFNPSSIPSGVRTLSLLNQKVRRAVWPYMIRTMVIEGEEGAQDIISALTRNSARSVAGDVKTRLDKGKGKAKPLGVSLFGSFEDEDSGLANQGDDSIEVKGDHEGEASSAWKTALRGRVESLIINIYLPETPLPTSPGIDLLLAFLAGSLRKLEIRLVEYVRPKKESDLTGQEGGEGLHRIEGTEELDLAMSPLEGRSAKAQHAVQIRHDREATGATIRVQEKAFAAQSGTSLPFSWQKEQLPGGSPAKQHAIYLPCLTSSVPALSSGSQEARFPRLVGLRIASVPDSSDPSMTSGQGQIINIDDLVRNAPLLRELRLTGHGTDAHTGLRIVGALRRQAATSEPVERHKDESELSAFVRIRGATETALGPLEVLQMELRGNTAYEAMLVRLVQTAAGISPDVGEISVTTEDTDSESTLKFLDIEVKDVGGSGSAMDWVNKTPILFPSSSVRPLALPTAPQPTTNVTQPLNITPEATSMPDQEEDLRDQPAIVDGYSVNVDGGMTSGCTPGVGGDGGRGAHTAEAGSDEVRPENERSSWLRTLLPRKPSPTGKSMTSKFLAPMVAGAFPLALLGFGSERDSRTTRIAISCAALIITIYAARHLTRLYNAQWSFLISPKRIVWADQVVVITGAASGIGALLAEEIAARKGKVVVLDINKSTATSEYIHSYQVDVSDSEAVQNVAKRISQEIGHTTILVNNAGVVSGKLVLDLEERDVRRTFDVNVLSHFWTLKAFLPKMIERGKGHVVTVGSVLGIVGAAQMTDYCASKAALLNLHSSLQFELKNRYDSPGIRTTLLLPGHVLTPLFSRLRLPKSRLFQWLAPALRPEEVVVEIVRALEDQESRVVRLPFYTQGARALGVGAGLIPGWARDWAQWWSGADWSMVGYGRG